MSEPVLLDGRYELLARLASGGEAEVYCAQDRAAGGEVAVRLARAGPAAKGSAQTVDLPAFHPGWVRFFRSGHDAARGPYQVYELLRGQTFRQLMERGAMQPAAWLDFARQSLETVAALHAAGWTHGDLNPSNLLRLDAAPVAWKLLELPFLRFEPGARPPLFGDLHTLAPEQLEGHAADPAADVYALGCLYYYAASGRYPHDVGAGADIAIARLRFPPEPLRDLAVDFSDARSAWVMSLLAREPGKRPAAAAAARQLLAIA